MEAVIKYLNSFQIEKEMAARLAKNVKLDGSAAGKAEQQMIGEWCEGWILKMEKSCDLC